MDRFNLFEAATLEDDDSRPDGFRRAELQIGPLLGASRLGARVYDLPPGQRVCPYHYEYNNEEWLLVVEGRPTLRTPTGTHELRPGDVVAFPEGPGGAHTTANDSGEDVRIVMLSSKRTPKVTVYPDSDKIAIYRLQGDEADEVIVKRSAATGYWDGELAAGASADPR